VRCSCGPGGRLHPQIGIVALEAFDEGSKGESLSLVAGVQFLRDNCPQIRTIPMVASGTFAVSFIWLTGSGDPATSRLDRIGTNADDIEHDDITSCGTLFLLFLHDQLGFGIPQIIGAGGATLADVWSHLTGGDRGDAFSTFADLVNLHYSLDNGPYNPALETVFPVPELNLLLAPGEVSWVSNGPPGQLQLLLTRRPRFR
jgi:hypothetical protein